MASQMRFGEAGLHWLTKVFNKIIMTRKMPEEWMRNILVPISKVDESYYEVNENGY